MRKIAISLLLAFAVSSGLAQQPKTFASAADVQALADRARQMRKANQPTVSQPILQLPPYSAMSLTAPPRR